MKTEQKFFLKVQDDLNTAIEYLERTKAHRVIFVVPKKTTLGSTLSNFSLLKKESIHLEKEIIVESVDEHILELASLAGISSYNPIFRIRERPVADIVLGKEEKVLLKKSKLKEEKTPEAVRSEEERDVKIPREKQEPKDFRRARSIARRILWATGIIAFSGVMIFFAVDILPRATIQLELVKTAVPFTVNVEVRKDVQTPSISDKTILLPSEFVSAKKNVQMEFSASGREEVKTFAKGTVAIYNAFSSASQQLVKGTRFRSPDGKIFRLQANIVVPGAEVKDGKIVPSHILADVVADESGNEYNIAAVEKFTIPGFSGTPKYDAFYASSSLPMKGGFEGERSVPTKEDLEKARREVEGKLRVVLENEMKIVLLDKFKLLPEASLYTLTKEETILSEKDESAFSFFKEAEMQYILFEESQLDRVLAQMLKPNVNYDTKVAKKTLAYESVSVVMTEGKMTFTVKGSLDFSLNIDASHFAKNILGGDERKIKGIVFGLPGVTRANISFWPFWVKSVPKDIKKVRVEVIE